MEAKLNEMPINKLVFNMSLPIMISMVIQALYNIVDSMFVSQYSIEALFAVSCVFPLQLLTIAVAVGCGVGLNSYIARKLGERHYDDASNAVWHGFIISAFFSTIFIIVGVFFSRYFIQLFTNDTQTINMGVDYISVIYMISISVFIQVLTEKVAQSCGKSIYTMFIQGSGAIINIILDPILIFGYFGFPALGVSGAAIATVIGQTCGASIGLFFLFKKLTVLQLNISKFKFKLKIIVDIMRVGLPAIIMQSIQTVMTLGMNTILLPYTSVAVNVYNVFFKLQSFIYLPVVGINNAVVAIVGFNYGARNYTRVKETVKFAIKFACSIMICGVIVFQLFPELLLSIYNADSSMIEIGISAFRTISLSFIFGGIILIICGAFQGCAKGLISMVIAISRQCLILLPITYILSLCFGLNGLWYSFIISELICVIFALYKYRKFSEVLDKDISNNDISN